MQVIRDRTEYLMTTLRLEWAEAENADTWDSFRGFDLTVRGESVFRRAAR